MTFASKKCWMRLINGKIPEHQDKMDMAQSRIESTCAPIYS